MEANLSAAHVSVDFNSPLQRRQPQSGCRLSRCTPVVHLLFCRIWTFMDALHNTCPTCKPAEPGWMATVQSCSTMTPQLDHKLLRHRPFITVRKAGPDLKLVGLKGRAVEGGHGEGFVVEQHPAVWSGDKPS